jgi:hypothetical protein
MISEKSVKPILSLDEYLLRFTSEDNASFSDIHENDREKMIQKLAIMAAPYQKLKNSEPIAIETSENKIFFDGY